MKGKSTDNLDKQFEIMFQNLKNPLSVEPMGDIKIETFVEDGGELYMVDESDSSASYELTPGKIEKGTIAVSDPVTLGIDSIYSLNFETKNMVPKDGQIYVVIPSDLQILADKMKSEGVCGQSADFVCPPVLQDGKQNRLVLQS